VGFVDIACVAYFTLLSTTASIIQQIHDIARWQDIAAEQFMRKVANPDSGYLSIGNGSVGLDLVLYYIRKEGRSFLKFSVEILIVARSEFYSYIAESLFVLFW
jgi:hypothetical protein